MKFIKQLLLGVYVLVSSLGFGQELSNFKQQIQNAKNSNIEFYEVGSILTPSKTTPKMSNPPKNAKYFNYNPEVAANLFTGATEYIILLLSAPNGEQNWVLDMIEVPQSFYNYQVKTSDGQTIQGSREKQRFYRGFVRGKEASSLVSINFYENQMSGFVSIEEEGNYNIGKAQDNREHIIYLDNSLSNEEFKCELETETVPKLKSQTQSFSHSTSGKCINIYLESRYNVYQNRGFSQTSTVNYITGLFSQVATIFANENILMQISELKMWVNPDTYSSNTVSGLLSQFQTQTTSMNGDLGQLLANQGFTIARGVAAGYSGLCNNNLSQKLSVASIRVTVPPSPIYNVAVYTMAHEFGHLLGSPHTHDPVWGSTGTARIDNCHIQVGVPGGGTIMSYCHITSSGINFNNGFGPEPGDLIRNSVANAACLGTCSSCPNIVLVTQNVLNGQTDNQQAGQTLTATNIIFNGGLADYRSFETIVLTPGFHSQLGSNTHLYIAPCISNPMINPQRTTQSNIGTTSEIQATITANLNVYPNPTNGTFTIVIPINQDNKSQNQRIGVYNLMGVAILDQEVQAGSQVKIDLTGKPKGIYLVKYFSGDQVIVKKVVYR